MKILLLSSTHNVKNGYGNITHELCSYLNNHFDINLLLPKNEPSRDTSYRVEHILPPYIFDVKTPKVFQYLSFDYPSQDFDIIHSLFEFPYAITGARIARKYKKPFIIGTQGTYAIRPLFMWPEKYFVRWAYNNADVITAPSAFTENALKKYAHTRTLIQRIHNGVNFERFSAQRDTSTLQKKFGNKIVLLTVGGLKPRKGQDIVLKALGKLKKHRSDFVYCIVGGGAKYKKYLEALVVENDLQDEVFFEGEFEGDLLVAYFQMCDIYVHTPQLHDWQFEGFGIVYLEASACRKPIIAADSGGVRDAVVDDKTGLVIPEGDVDSTAEAIGRLLDDSSLRSELGNNGYEYARDHDWSRIGERFTILYQTLIKNRNE
jgi:phosphatidylinositol alpha-1,6-mannosyltransferase